MAPRRAVRATASPSPAPQSRASTPARGEIARTAVPAKYSTSYGSPITQLPDRSNVGGGGNVTRAAAEIFTAVQRDNVAAEARRRDNHRTRAGLRGTSASPAPAVQPPIEVEEPESDDQGTGEDEGSEYEDQAEPETNHRATRKSPQKAVRKRARDDEEAEARAEKERKERDARLKRERSAEARKRRSKKLAEAQAAANKKAEEERAAEQAAEQAAREEAAKAAMPPPPQPSVPRPVPDITVTPPSARGALSPDLNDGRPSSVRSFIEEVNIFRETGVQTPVSASPKNEAANPESPRSDTDEEVPQQTSPPQSSTGSTFVSRLRNRLKPLPRSVRDSGDRVESPPRWDTDAPRPLWSSVKHALSPWSILKTLLCAFVMLHFARFVQTVARPDLFDSPGFPNWYGWQDWTNNVGQFFPSPLLHPLGVLTDDQYDDLQEYLERRTTTIESVVDSLKSTMPKVVSVRKDKEGRILVADEFWDALKDRILKDSRILSLDGNARISEAHWKAIEQRLKTAGLLDKRLTPGDVEQILDKSGPASWENWLRKNKQKVTDILGQGKAPASRGSDETLISREDFIRELNDRVAKSKEEIASEVDTFQGKLHDLVADVKKIASAGGMSKADTTALVAQVVDREITRRLSRIGANHGAAGIDAMFRHRVNHFSPGNAAHADISLSSPTYQLEPARVGSKEWLKKTKEHPQFLRDKSQALTPWTDAGHCWCAGTLGEHNRTLPAVLAVRLPHFVIPQHIVLEHVDPAATTDPRAMPRDVEVWALFDEHARRERVLDWAAAQFPQDNSANANANSANIANNSGEGWVKIGQFTYEYRPQDEGVYVHALSRDLAERLKAATDFVMVRAVTNYGARDHTCFYRVRMYGELVEDLEAERESRYW
ncbi:hypothetical protein NEMBOFW57_006654 [Staphylotrichum longicolle]|uniref:SUN domain-containing protein n=1 Tax=Staphylotrichum longicolle TaxID=669026 RepID=A0AAD4HUN0_9PEZI|nr:hypothetical protein NEMBOFW57_006654 [Staphylotrichum longicolle]